METFTLAVRITVILMGVCFAFFVIRSMIGKKILEAQGLIWVMASVCIIIVGVYPYLLVQVGNWLGFADGLSLFMLLLDFVFLIAIFLCTKWISMLTKRVHELAMQVSLLNQENERIMRRLADMNDLHKTEL